MRLFRILLWSVFGLGLGLALLAAGATGWLAWKARDGAPPTRGVPTAAVRPATTTTGEPQILFGDLHVHTTYSSDAFTYSLPLFQGEGAHPPADACDFARFCSALDFWSINDHAEQLTAAHWTETKAAIRECNEIAGDPDTPDLVSFLGWEWSQTGLSPETHFGHRNVVLLDTGEAQVPSRPIAAGTDAIHLGWGWIGLALTLAEPGTHPEEADFYRYLWDNRSQEVCPEGVDVRELPPDCKEGAPDPRALFEKLDQWGFPNLVIPHGLAWGTTNPAGATLEGQLGAQHDPGRQRLLEVYSGHGSSERFAELTHIIREENGEVSCPEPTDSFEPCCWRAGEIIRARCDDPTSSVCEEEVVAARLAAAEAARSPLGSSLEGATLEDWGDCGQLRGASQAAFHYRPKQSAQMALALKQGEAESDRFRFGLIGSSDNHRARPGTGYKEMGPGAMTDGMRGQPEWSKGSWVEPILAPRIADSFYFTGGLVAVHATGRDRGSIFDALSRRQVYGTTGPRIQLWFDALHTDGSRQPMGSEVSAGGVTRFQVRASGAREQKPGCPEFVWDRLGPQRTESLCLAECHHPGERRHPITRIEVVRIRPQLDASDAIAPLIEDPWKVLPCPGAGDGCQVEFEDPELASATREYVYYVRALQAPTPALNGDPLRCDRDESGACIQSRPCRPPAIGEAWSDDCLSPVEEMAFSSPIFVAPGRTSGGTAANNQDGN